MCLVKTTATEQTLSAKHIKSHLEGLAHGILAQFVAIGTFSKSGRLSFIRVFSL
jgi:hypothetical protein